MAEQLPPHQTENLTYDQIHLLIEDMFLSWQFIRINLGESDLKTFHQERFNFIKEQLTPYWEEVKGEA